MEVPGGWPCGQGIVSSTVHLRPQQYAATAALWSVEALSPLLSRGVLASQKGHGTHPDCPQLEALRTRVSRVQRNPESLHRTGR